MSYLDWKKVDMLYDTALRLCINNPTKSRKNYLLNIAGGGRIRSGVYVSSKCI